MDEFRIIDSAGTVDTSIDLDPQVYNRTYMLTEWDPAKGRLNARKHGVLFADAVGCLEDEGALTMRDSSADDEERWVTMGMDAMGRVLVVVYTWRAESVRLIPARKATARERRLAVSPAPRLRRLGARRTRTRRRLPTRRLRMRAAAPASSVRRRTSRTSRSRR